MKSPMGTSRSRARRRVVLGTVAAACIAAVALGPASATAAAPAGTGEASRASRGVSAPAAPARASIPGFGSTDPATRIAAFGAVASAADSRVGVLTTQRANLLADLVLAQQEEAAARNRTDALSQAATAAAARAQASKARLQDFAAAAYMDQGSPPPFVALMSSSSVTEFAYRSELIKQAGEERQRVIRQALHDEKASLAAADAARVERDRLIRTANDLQGQAQDVTTRIATAQQEGVWARSWGARWQAIAAGPVTTILGMPAVTAPEMAAWYGSTRHQARTTVPLATLAEDFVTEGLRLHVRSDIAFAQSMLETASLNFPDGGQVAPSDNNFAGVGACDSCVHGDSFPDALTGVQAQLQYLRVYADPGLTPTSLGEPAIKPDLFSHFLKGKVATWEALGGTWATGAGYGDAILGIYEQMLAWTTDHAPAGEVAPVPTLGATSGGGVTPAAPGGVAAAPPGA